MDIILIMIMVCGQPDTVIIKQGKGVPTYTHDVRNETVVHQVGELLKKDPTVIIYEDKRGTCA